MNDEHELSNAKILKDSIEPIERLDVKQVSQYEIESLQRNPPERTIDVEMGNWVETDGNTPILNIGGAPCLIIYARNLETDNIISGHFPETDPQKQDMFVRNDLTFVENKFGDPGGGIVVADEQQTAYLSYKRKDKYYEEYVRMKKRLKEWGGENTEVFLFGTNAGAFGGNPAEYAQRVVNSAIEQHDVSADLYELGISYSRQHDHRTPGQHNVDDTFYSPEDRTIKHGIRSQKDKGMFWLRNRKLNNE